jgi:hypothetical protein
MATSSVAIANRALQKLGARRIESLTQDHPNARSMSAAYATVRDAELRRYTWGFATRRASLPADGEQTAWGQLNRFSVPDDYIRLIRDDETGQRTDWKIEGGDEGEGVFIVTADGAPLDIKYVARVEDVNSYDALFVEAFACKLALETCEEITQSTSKKGSISADYDKAIADAKKFGAIEKDAQEFPEDDWVNARL